MNIRKSLFWGFLFVISTSCDDDTLYTPTDLTAVMISATEVKLSWRDRTSAEDGYGISLKTGRKWGFTAIGEVGVDVTTFIDVDLIEGTKYTYRVYAFRNETSERSYPVEVSITP
jgi:large repetitive protein